jgi:hypothetical protein
LVEYKWVVLSNTTPGTLMSSVGSNIVFIALPTIARDLSGTSPFDLLWVLLGYQLVTATVLVNLDSTSLLTSNREGDRGVGKSGPNWSSAPRLKRPLGPARSDW